MEIVGPTSEHGMAVSILALLAAAAEVVYVVFAE